MAESGLPDTDIQKSTILNLIKVPLKKGDSWFLLDIRWFKQWKKYVGFDLWDTLNTGDEAYNPGLIDNTALFKEATPENSTPRLKDHLVDDLDYVLLPAEAWKKIKGWYGLAEGQDPIERHVIEQGMFVKHCKVEVYLMDLKLCENSDISKVVHKQFSRASTIEQLEQGLRHVFHIDENKDVRLWNRYMSNTYEHLTKKSNTLQDAGLYQGQVIVVEQKNDDGTWPRQTKNTSSYSSNNPYSTSTSTSSSSRSGYGSMGSSTTSNSSTSSSGYNYDTGYSSTSSSYYNTYNKGGSSNSKAGLCGLANLGNTCFMNSALQCMSNVPGLTEYMLSGKWEQELNRDNPLGMKGEIAMSFAELIRDIWTEMRSYTVPRNFKLALGRFAPQFSGYQQQDSQELMAFLLDGLHEDLNRIHKKPYIEVKDSSGRDDSVVAKEAWDNYKKRNDSVIVDSFHGLLKSTVECPDCQKISVTFDPFCYLSLPLPIKKERQIDVLWVSLSPAAKPLQFKLSVPKDGCVLDLCKAVSHYINVPPERMVVTDVYNHRFHKIFSLDEGLSNIMEKDDIFIYEVPARSPSEADRILVPVYFRQLKRRQPASYSNSNQLFGHPFILSFPATCTYDTMYNVMLERMSRYVHAPKPGEVWWKVEKVEKKESEQEKTKESSVDQQPTTTQTPVPVQESAKVENEGQNKDDVKMETDNAGGDSEIKNEGEASTSSKEMEMNQPQEKTATKEAVSKEMEVNLSEEKAAAKEAVSKEMEVNGPQEKATVKEAVEAEKVVKSRRIFTVACVNSYGSSDLLQQISDCDDVYILSNQTYLSADWSSLAKSKFYDEKAAEEADEHDSMHHRNAQKRTELQLEDCVRLFTEAEKLSEQDPWYCPQCRKHQQATKKFDLWSLPEYLIIHLKRFSYNRYWRDKIDALVDFPTQGLDLRKYILSRENRDGNVYDLIAVTNHYGGMGGGHYTAFAQNKENGDWYYFDDSNVSSSSEESVVTKAAYVLVYKRRRVESPSRNILSMKQEAEESDNRTNDSKESSINGYNEDDDMDTN